MDFKKFFVAGLAIATFASCNDEDKVQIPEGGGTKTVEINVEDGMKTKSPANPVTDGESVTFTDGYIYFTNVRGQITDFYEIIQGTTDMDNKVININDIKTATAPIVFEVPEVSENIYVFGNIPASIGNLPTNGNISNVTGMMSRVETQTSITGDVSNVYLFGKGDIVENPGTAGSDYRAYVEVAPIAARLEVAKLTAGGSIASYKVEGIFINYFYGYAGLDGTPDPAEFYPFTAFDEFTQGASSTAPWYGAAMTGVLHDWDRDYNLADIVAKAATPKGGSVWAYNLFVGEEIPHLIVKLRDVVLVDDNNDPVAGWDTEIPYYITVKNFKDSEGRINKFLSGYVYNIGNISFTEENLGEYPEMHDDINVDVTIRVIDWKVKSIEADFDE